MPSSVTFSDRLGLTIPLIQAPMAGVSTPALAAAVSDAGALGSIAIGATDVSDARSMIDDVRRLTSAPFNVNVFAHAAPTVDPRRDAAWLRALRPSFAGLGAEPPASLRTIYRSFADDPAMLDLLVELAPRVVSFHFGLPQVSTIWALRKRGVTLIATATSLDEALAIEAAGLDGVVAQGIEAGGHRGVFDPSARDDGLGTMALTRLLVRNTSLPVVAAGGLMDGAGVAAALALGAAAAQLGTAFVGCPESAAPDGHRRALFGPPAYHTVMTSLISGRPARALPNRFTVLSETLDGLRPPDYPIAYDAGKALHAAARAVGEEGFGAYWAGQGAPLARALPAADLVAVLREELQVALRAEYVPQNRGPISGSD